MDRPNAVRKDQPLPPDNGATYNDPSNPPCTAASRNRMGEQIEG